MKLFQLLTGAALAVALTLPICVSAGQPATMARYSAASLFNQGNSFARNGKIGPAILNYERAQLLSPNDGDIAANLHYVRAKAALPDAPSSRLARALMFARPSALAWFGCLGLALAGTSILLVARYPQRRAILRPLTAAGALLAAIAIGNAVAIWPEMNEAVVMAHAPPVYNSPVSVGEAAFKLREGETVTVRAERQNFALVQTSEGRSGWVARADLVRIIPPSNDRSQP